MAQPITDIRQAFAAAKRLPQERKEIWLLLIRRVHAFVGDEQERPVRPYVFLLFSLSPQTNLLAQELVTTGPVGHFPVLDEIVPFLLQHMFKPKKSLDLPARRPQGIVIIQDHLFRLLKELLEKPLDLNVMPMTEEENAGFGDEVFKSYSRMLIEQDIGAAGPASYRPGMLSVPGVTPVLAASFHQQAKAFYEAAPWKHLPNSAAYAVRVGREIRYFTVFGADPAETPGIAYFLSWDEFAVLLKDGRPEISRSMLYMSPPYVPFDDLDDMERYGWEVADEATISKAAAKERADDCGTVPVVATFEGENTTRPSAAELRWLEYGMAAMMELSTKAQDDKDFIMATIKEDYKIDGVRAQGGSPMTIATRVCGKEHPGGQWADDYVPKVPEDARTCANCQSKEDELSSRYKKCSRCKSVYYCSTDCQSSHWKGGHRRQCQPLK